MSVYNVLSYRMGLEWRLSQLKVSGKKVNRTVMAQAIGIQQPYLSKVFQGRADFSTDQLFKACEFLALSAEETEYLGLLLEFEKSQIPKRKLVLREKIETIRNSKTDTQEYLKASQKLQIDEYYYDPINQLVHMGLILKRFSEDAQQLSQAIGVSESKIQEALDNLRQWGIIEFKDGKWEVRVKTLHLKKGSKILSAWGNSVRLLSLKKSWEKESPENYRFATFFTSNPNVAAQLKTRILELLQEFEKKVTHSDPQEVYQLSIDLLRWT